MNTFLQELKPKKILALVQLPPPVHGASLMNKSLIESKLIQKLFTIKLLNLCFNKEIADLRKFSINKLLKAIILYFKLIAILVNDNIDLIYFTLSPNAYALYRDFVFICFIKLFKSKLVYHLHGKGINTFYEKSKINKILLKIIFSNVKVICLSKSLVNDIRAVYQGEPYIVNNGIYEQLERNWIKPLSNGSVKILFLSNFIKEKGILDFIDALEIVDNEYHLDFEIFLIGKERGQLTYEYIINYINERNMSQRLKKIGSAYNEEKIEILSESDIFVFPTYYQNETFGIVNIEAMQFGIPVISTYEGAIPDVIDNENTGFIVPARDIRKIAEKIKLLIEDENLRRIMGYKGREKFIKKYTFQVFEENIKNVFEDIIYNT